MKTFITGGSGMLGRVLVRHFDNVIAPSQEEFDLLKQIPEFSKCDTIIHCAAMTVVDDCEKNQSLCRQVNVEGTVRVVELARLWNARLIFISTPMVFSGVNGNYREDDQPDPINLYGDTKREAEQVVLAYPQGIVIRSNPIGVRPPGFFPSFIQWFVDAARTNRSFELFTDVNVNPISTERLADAIVKLVGREVNDSILHLGSRDVANKADIWERIRQQFPDYQGTVTRTSVDQTVAGTKATRPKEMWLNVERIQQVYGIPMPSWNEEVDRVVKEIMQTL